MATRTYQLEDVGLMLFLRPGSPRSQRHLKQPSFVMLSQTARI